jgi:hypothetical protein
MCGTEVREYSLTATAPVSLRLTPAVSSPAQAVEDTGELDGDIATTLDQDALGQLLEMKRLIGGDDVLPSLDILAKRRRGPGCNQNVFGPHSVAGGRKLDGVRVEDRRPALDDLDLGAL